MNYCPACRRHLNGALACAGCGTPAEYLMPAAPAAAPTTAPDEPAPQPTLAGVYADSLVVLSVPNERRAGARRRSTQRKRRRTVLAVGLGLLLATAGSVGVATMATDGQSTDRAATVVLTDDAGPQQPEPLPDLPTSGAPAGPSGKATAKAAAGPAKKSGSGAPSAGAAQPAPVSSAPAPSTSRSASGTSRPGVKPTTSGKPSQSATGGPQPPTSTPTPPAPTPTPPEDCGFLGWKCW
ncbi:SCO2400 family protein [Streptomyces sp. NBC_00190]|uniref:SCO2400 family protein n=1 Tax=Streptomyces sp. NBC_00190 TaxID=2903634 RepID=UPI003FA738E2